MNQKHDADYWIARLRRDSRRLSDKQKIKLTAILLMHVVPLKVEEADFFLERTPNSADALLRYSLIESKVAEVWSAREELFLTPQARRGFLKDFRTALRSLYTKQELDEITVNLNFSERLSTSQ